MRFQWLGRFWHEVLGRSYQLAVPINEGKGQAVILLHGIASDHRAWGYVLPHISTKCRIIALDLLGFGDSPKPKNIEYTAEDHARAVIATLGRLRVKKAIIVGHSMGSLVAVEIAKQRPGMVKQLILCGMPVYQFDARRRLLPNQDAVYVRLYRSLMSEKFALRASKSILRLRPDLVGFGVDADNYYSFSKSLENTIMKQTTYGDIQAVKAPVYMVSGRLDAFVIRRHQRTLSGLIKGSTYQLLGGPHEVTQMLGLYLAEVIDAMVEKRPVREDALPKKARGIVKTKLRRASRPADSAQIEKH